MQAFKAFRILAEGENNGRLETLALSDLADDGVLVQVHYSSINYKDALAVTGRGKILRRFPLTGGIDLAGIVVASQDERFKPGDAVLATSYGLSYDHDGGYSQYQRVPADWLLHLPKGLSLYESMVIGTAGFTAAQAIQRMLDNGQCPEMGPVIVTGASGGVGSFAIDCLSALNFEVIALSGKTDAVDYLKALGAVEVLDRRSISMGMRPLESGRWGGAVDTVGGDVLAWLTRTMKPNANIAVCGLAAGIELHTTVMPFIIRGVNLLGIDSAMCAMPMRQKVWQRLASDMKPRHLDRIVTQVVSLEQIPSVSEQMLNNKTHGRYVIDLTV